MLFEWGTVAYIAWGVSRGGTSLKNLIGGKWETAKDVFKDIGVWLGFWIVALFVLGATALAIHAPRAAREPAKNRAGALR
ncbi:MAG TPA: hypothetical protein VJN89_02450 [Candidatus Acidoferrum sp.]|nr:hypothetical protein [Candidatus Acidoferrum sp.]